MDRQTEPKLMTIDGREFQVRVFESRQRRERIILVMRLNMRPVCWKCQAEMRCKQNDFRVELEGFMPRLGDLYECETCGNQIVTGFGRPIEK